MDMLLSCSWYRENNKKFSQIQNNLRTIAGQFYIICLVLDFTDHIATYSVFALCRMAHDMYSIFIYLSCGRRGKL